MQPLISIQILNWNRAEESIRAIESAINQTYPNIEIVFVDNGSSDDSVSMVKRIYPDVKVVELYENFGCPGGRNRGIQYCQGEFIFYLDNDGVLHKDAVSRAYSSIIENENNVVVTGIVYDFESEAEVDTSIKSISNKKYNYSNFQGGICMHRKSMYNVVGKYPDHFMYGGEEWYLSAKIIDENYRIIKDETVILWHKKSDIARNREKELMNSFFNKLFCVVNLYPIERAILFVVFFPFVYYMHARRENISKSFLNTLKKNYFSTIRKALINRKSISRKSLSFMLKNS